ncbi:MAG: WD40 repeat domain-containing protein [Planctomycetota bacterium]|nr:WD40 repeat domain-containing protein [Planctomycetota bacterium]
MSKFMGIAVVVAFAGTAFAGIGNVNDAYINGDSTGDVYQVRLDGTYVPGNYANMGGNSYVPQNVFTSRNQGTAFPYLTAFGGPTNNFFVFDFSAGIQEVDGNTGAAVFNYASIVGSTSLDGDFGGDGFLYAAGNGGIWQVDPVNHTGSLIHSTPWGGNTIVEINGDDMFVSGWNASEIRRYSVSNPGAGFTVLSANTGFPVQDIEARLTSNGQEIFASALYLTPSTNGIYKYDNMGGFTMFSPADSTTTPGVTGPHGFAFGPDGKMYAAYQTGTVEVFDAVSGAFLYTLTNSGAKLTDVTFKPIPAPGAAALLGLAGLVAGRRRRTA